MNDVDIKKLLDSRYAILKKYKLLEEDKEKFRKKIVETTFPSADLSSGKEIYDMLSSGYNESTDISKVTELICGGANIEYKEFNSGNRSLHICAKKNFINTYALLLRAGANVNAKNEFLSTPMMWAAKYGYYEIIAISIAVGADVNIRCMDGDTAIMIAKRHSFTDCFKLLKDAGAHLNKMNMLNQTMFDIDGTVDEDITILGRSPEGEEKHISASDPIELIDEAQLKLKRVLEKS